MNSGTSPPLRASTPSPPNGAPARNPGPSWFTAAALLASAILLQSWSLETVVEDARLATRIVSYETWRAFVVARGWPLRALSPQESAPAATAVDLILPQRTDASGTFITVATALMVLSAWAAAGLIESRGSRNGLSAVLRRSACRAGVWGIAGGSWFVLHEIAALLPWEGPLAFVRGSPQLWMVVSLAGALSALWGGGDRGPSGSARRPVLLLGLAVCAYAAAFGTMNGRLWATLRIPHGDSAMYEEHLWNLLHGKGFRSNLDDGRLFLGEHLQVVHLLLLPLYVVWPSHLLLEFCETAALALGAVPVFLMARRRSGSAAAASWLGAAYLAYVPMQRLDIAIDFKTFRPEAFGIPLLLAAFEALDAQRRRACAIWLALALLVKEDVALVLFGLGGWIALEALRTRWKAPPTDALRAAAARTTAWGVVLMAGSAAYLLLALKVVIPWFRRGADPHTARYFSDFGGTLTEVIWGMITQPGLLAAKYWNFDVLLYALELLLPLAFLPLRAPLRLLAGLPLFGVLCLNQIVRDANHHFHAPLVAVLFWASAAALAPRRPPDEPPAPDATDAAVLRRARRAGLFSAVFGLFFSFAPWGIAFWDPGSPFSWRAKYVADERVRMFSRVFEQIPVSSRVASTDFVHPRFTHHAESYDYSDYRPTVPADTDYIVIDTAGPYAAIAHPGMVKELRDSPDAWELLEDRTGGYFIVLRRRR